jgi:hypothetical protein
MVSIPNYQLSAVPDSSSSLIIVARRSKKQLVDRAVVVDTQYKPVVWGTGDVLSCECSFVICISA